MNTSGIFFVGFICSSCSFVSCVL